MKFKKAKPVGRNLEGMEGWNLLYYSKEIDMERKQVHNAFCFLRANWGTTEGYEKLKEFINDTEEGE